MSVTTGLSRESCWQQLGVIRMAAANPTTANQGVAETYARDCRQRCGRRVNVELGGHVQDDRLCV